jgi:hypothetical protein
MIDLTAIQDFLAAVETMENRLRIYDAALRFAKENHPAEALIFEGCMAIAGQQVDLFSSPELDVLRGKARELLLRVAQDLDRQSKT